MVQKKELQQARCSIISTEIDNKNRTELINRFRLTFIDNRDEFWAILFDAFKDKNMTIEEVNNCYHIVKNNFIYDKPKLAHFLNYANLYKLDYNKLMYRKILIYYDNDISARNYLEFIGHILKFDEIIIKELLTFKDFNILHMTYNTHSQNINNNVNILLSSYEVKSHTSLYLGLYEWIVKRFN